MWLGVLEHFIIHNSYDEFLQKSSLLAEFRKAEYAHLVSALRAPTAEQNEKFWLSAEQNPKEPAQHYQKQQTKVVRLGCSIE